MKGKASAITFVIRAAGFVKETFLNVFPRVGASERNAVGNETKAKRLGPTLLLALPFLVVLIAEAVDSTRTINVTVSRCGFSPERIELQVGERIRLSVLSLDGTPGFQAKGLGLTPKEVGTFAINCSEYCGRDHRSMQASLIVTPRR
jgi:hypothetical protein